MTKTVESNSKSFAKVSYLETKTGGGRTGGGVKEPWGREPLNPPGGDDDTTLLIWLLETIENELYRFVYGRERNFRGRWRTECQAVWPLIEGRFVTARQILEFGSDDVKSNLDLAGLTGDMLRMKSRLLSSGLNVFRESLGELSITNPQPRRPRPIRKIKDWVFEALNKILGSLAKVFPVLEGVKEYKEHVELSVKAQELRMI